MRRHTVVSASAAIAALLLAGMTIPAGAAEGGVVINEFSVDTTGTDVEYVELLAPPGTADLGAYRVLEIEGDAPGTGLVDEVIAFPAPDAAGRSLVSLGANTLENGTVSLLLVTGAVPALGTDLDVDGDGVLEASGLTIVDAVAISDGGADDRTYGGVTLAAGYDGSSFRPGGASRVPDGTDTDTTADWVRNDFDLAGISGYAGSLVPGEAVNTPGAPNTTVLEPTGPGEGEAGCELETVPIGSVQGAGPTSPVSGSVVRVEGTVVADFQTGGFDGYYLQDGGDGDSATSDGILIYAPGGAEVAVGDVVNVAGAVSEWTAVNGGTETLTEITAADIEICGTAELPAPIPLELPASAEQREALEGMYVTLPQTLTILEYFEFGRFGTLDVGLNRQMQPTAVYEPGSDAAKALAIQNASERITIDDGRSFQNPDPAVHPNGETFTLENTFRGGDLLRAITGVLDYRNDQWAIQPTQGAGYESVNPRPDVPDVGGDITVASFNVLNYFTTIDPTPTDSNDDDRTRGADTALEFERQQAKVVSALAAIDADIFGLIEIENNGTAVAALTEALNDVVGEGTYTYIDTGVIGTDAITTALVYKPSTVEPLGEHRLLTSEVDERFLDAFNRPALAQTFGNVDGAGEVTVVVNHLKSKGSNCNDVQDPDTGDGSGNCNVTRAQAAAAIADWLATDPTGQGTGNELIIGDLNSYDKEAPIDALVAQGYTDLLREFQGEYAYSYVFDGQLGYLDYALAGQALVDDVTAAAVWHINADEPGLIDYDMSFKRPAQDALFAPDPYRSSDHDPVIVGIDFDTVPPTLSVTAEPRMIWPPDNKLRTITITVAAADDSGEVDVELIDTSATGNKKAEITQLSETSFSVVAAIDSVYTFTYEATDEAGNATTATAEVRVER